MVKKYTGTLTFAEARELGIPEDLVAFAEESPESRGKLPFSVDSLRRDQRVREVMKAHDVAYDKAYLLLMRGEEVW